MSRIKCENVPTDLPTRFDSTPGNPEFLRAHGAPQPFRAGSLTVGAHSVDLTNRTFTLEAVPDPIYQRLSLSRVALVLATGVGGIVGEL